MRRDFEPVEAKVNAKINSGLEKFMSDKGYSSIDEMVGLAHREL